MILELGKSLDRPVLKEHSRQRKPSRKLSVHRGIERQRMVEEIQDSAKCKEGEMHRL